MKHGFIKVAAATPKVTVANCGKNLSELLTLQGKADELGVKLLVFPELALTGYTCADLVYSDVLLNAATKALLEYADATKDSDMISIVGFPIVVNDKIYNSAAICQKGAILGIVPKNSTPNRGELSEGRYFAPAPYDVEYITIGGEKVPFGKNIIFTCNELPELRIAVEICEDLFSAIPPSAYHASAGATVIANPAASSDAVGKAEKAKLQVAVQSNKLTCAYIFSNCGDGESTTDLVFGGHSFISENGTVIAEREPFCEISEPLLVSEIDVKKLSFERRRMNRFDIDGSAYVKVGFSIGLCETKLTRRISPHPFTPDSDEERRKRCDHILTLQARGLKQRLEKAYADRCVIGISGGLDSCLAILVAAEALDMLGRERRDIVGVTMPCFGTTGRTRTNAEILCAELGAEMRCVDIGEAVRLHFKDIDHDESVHDVVYENSQARERTQVIMDIANEVNGIVVGTGDLSELALGWATYNGDHMSMYGVNASLPKTLVRHVVARYAERAEQEGKLKLAEVLRDILDTPVSPELLPADENGDIAQKTEDIVGPYEIHDFYLYNMVRYGFTPDKLFRLARYAFDGAYNDAVLLKWLKNFIRRFFAQQFKRSCLPDGPKVGSVSLSPRGDWCMPSDASREEWLKIAEEL